MRERERQTIKVWSKSLLHLHSTCNYIWAKLTQKVETASVNFSLCESSASRKCRPISDFYTTFSSLPFTLDLMHCFHQNYKLSLSLNYPQAAHTLVDLRFSDVNNFYKFVDFKNLGFKLCLH